MAETRGLHSAHLGTVLRVEGTETAEVSRMSWPRAGDDLAQPD